MGSSKVFALAAGCFAISVSVGAARAADLLPAPLPMAEPMVEEFGGWYLRGDVGVGLLDYDKTRVTQTAGFVDTTTTYTGLKGTLDDQVFIGGGVGYAYSSWLRFDVTGEYRTKTDWKFSERAEGPFIGGGFIPGFNVTKAKLSSAVGLANAYFDLGTWYGLSPFIGAGVGFAHHMFTGIEDTGFGSFAGGYGFGRAKDKTELAWALHAGVGYAVSPNLKLELAYRYLNMGEGHAGTVICQGGSFSCGSPGLQVAYKLKDIESHDIKLGMRWALNGPTEVYAPPAPLVRKY